MDMSIDRGANESGWLLREEHVTAKQKKNRKIRGEDCVNPNAGAVSEIREFQRDLWRGPTTVSLVGNDAPRASLYVSRVDDYSISIADNECGCFHIVLFCHRGNRERLLVIIMLVAPRCNFADALHRNYIYGGIARGFIGIAEWCCKIDIIQSPLKQVKRRLVAAGIVRVIKLQNDFTLENFGEK